ncbi:MAG TPA: hypothetical protein VNR89_11900 [Roseomonas sp.]|nr:hypothetical protein [Roseomonas sp.]
MLYFTYFLSSLAIRHNGSGYPFESAQNSCRREPSRHINKRKPRPAAPAVTLPETEHRFGGLDRHGRWTGHPQEVGEDQVALDRDQPRDLSKIRRIRSGVLSLFQAGKLSDAHLAAADRWHAD